MIQENSSSQLHIITRIVSLACIMSMLLSHRLWMGHRTFPLNPVFDFLPNFPQPFDIISFLVAILLLICISIFPNPQKFIIGFLGGAVVLALLDLNRWQPWFYQYVMMLFVLSFFKYNGEDSKHKNAIIAFVQLMMGAIYFWSGLHKFNPHFFAETFPWLMEPITSHLGTNSVSHFKFLAYFFPVIEIATGIGLFIKPTRKYAMILALIMHTFILFVTGPLGHNYNPVIWPWNIAMMCFNIVLFYKRESFSLAHLKDALKYHSIKVVILLFVVMPMFNFFNLWDSYLSHSLYSGKTSNASLYVSDNVKQKMPEAIKLYATGEMNRNEILIKYWCISELSVPPYPEKRNFEAVAKTFYQYAKDSSEIYFKFVP